MKHKKIKIFSLLLVALTFFVIGISCGGSDKSEFSIKLVDYVDRDLLVIGSEYDAESLLQKESGVDYKIESLFYLDETFEKQEIPFNGTKFTQNAPYDVSVIIAAEKGEQKDSALVELKINYQLDPIIKRFKESWCDNGVVKTYSAKPEYLKGNAVTAVKMRYVGNINFDHNNGINFGNFTANGAKEEFTVKDWSNAVVEMDVFNAHTQDLEMGMLLMRKVDGQSQYQIKLMQRIPAGEWTHITWSLRAIGWSGDFIAGGGYIDIKLRQYEDDPDGNYNYTFYCCNVNVSDYDPEKHPDVETRTDDEIKQAYYDSEAAKISGDKQEKQMAILLRDTSNYTATTSTEHKKIGEASVQYTFTRKAEVSTPTINRGTLLNDQKGLLSEYFTITDWKNVYLGFWAKNPSDVSIGIMPCFANTQDGKTYMGSSSFSFWGYGITNGVRHNKAIRANTDWTYMEWSLNEIFPTLYTDKVQSYKFSLATEIILENDGDSVMFYIDGLSIYSKKPIDSFDSALTSTTTSSAFDQEIYTDDETNVKDGYSSVKVTYTGNNYGGENSVFKVANGGIAFMIPDNQQQQIYEKFSAYDKDKDTYKSQTEKTYAGFWVKNTTGKKLTVCFNLRLFYQSGESVSSYVYGSAYLNQVANDNNTTALEIAASDTGWHYYELELPDLPDDLYDAHKIRMGVAATIENIAEGDAFYLDGFDIYHGSKFA